MDAWLAQVYGTGGGDDLEKVAQSLMLEKLAAQEGVDLSGLSQEELDALAAEVLTEEEGGEGAQAGAAGAGQAQGGEAAGQGGGEAGVVAQGAQAGSPEELAKEAQAKFEEADFLGRVMAHAYTQEIEKIASAGSALRGAAGKAGGAIRAAGKKVDDKAMGLGQKLRFGKSQGPMTSGQARGRGYGAAGGAAAAGAAGVAAAGKDKKASAFEKLAEMRAAEILQENGIDPATGAPAQQPTDADRVSQAVDGRAQEILRAKGYAFEGDEGGGQAAQQQGGAQAAGAVQA